MPTWPMMAAPARVTSAPISNGGMKIMIPHASCTGVQRGQHGGVGVADFNCHERREPQYAEKRRPIKRHLGHSAQAPADAYGEHRHSQEQ